MCVGAKSGFFAWDEHFRPIGSKAVEQYRENSTLSEILISIIS